MRSTVLALVLLAACRSASAPPAAEPLPDPIPMLVEVGRTEFVRHCAACHGMDAKGGGPVAEALRAPPADLTRIAERRGGVFPSGEIADWIDGRLAPSAHGPREMPIWGARFAEGLPPDPLTQDLVRGRIVTLVEYLRSIQAR